MKKSREELENDSSAVRNSRNIVEKALIDGSTHYGINTGFGALANKRVSGDQLTQLQRNLILSHSVGVGDLIPKEICRLILQLMIHALGIGYSGISMETLNRLLCFLDHDLVPAIPEKGSVGASGDLAPLAHMSLPLIGTGHFWDEDGSEIIETSELLKCHNLEPIELQSKDGLSLINGTQLMSAYGAYMLEKTLHLLKVADVTSAMCLEALQGSITPFDERIHEIRPHLGQKEVAELASISERRTYLLLDGHDGLTKLLMQETGINSGFMIPQYTSAALVSENKVLCHPSSVDSIPTSLGQEDYVSMGNISALYLLKVYQNVETVLAIELFTAAQALDFRNPLKPDDGVEMAYQYIRKAIPHAMEDHYFRDDINPAVEMIHDRKQICSLDREEYYLH